jgi:hypothetical protein
VHNCPRKINSRCFVNPSQSQHWRGFAANFPMSDGADQVPVRVSREMR